MVVRIKRAYEPPARGDGRRVFVDRLWPRGCPRNALRIVAAWPRELAPSDALRRWFAHDLRRWQEFRRRYRTELRAASKRAFLRGMAGRAQRGPDTLVYAARDEERNNAVVVAAVLERLVRSHRGRKRA
jgi:uncharacterized protein YeaO (DUF488 family)